MGKPLRTVLLAELSQHQIIWDIYYISYVDQSVVYLSVTLTL